MKYPVGHLFLYKGGRPNGCITQLPHTPSHASPQKCTYCIFPNGMIQLTRSRPQHVSFKSSFLLTDNWSLTYFALFANGLRGMVNDAGWKQLFSRWCRAKCNLYCWVELCWNFPLCISSCSGSCWASGANRTSGCKGKQCLLDLWC